MKYIFLILILGCTSRRMTSNVVILDGTASKILNGDGTGSFKSWKWRQIEGVKCAIDSPSSVITQTVVGTGKFAWELTGTDNLGNVGKDTFSIVN